MKKTIMACAGMVVAGLLVSIVVWSRVPDPMPIHWDASGHADGFVSRAVGLLFGPLFGAALSAFVLWLTSRHPEARKVASPVTLALAGFQLGMHLLVVHAALDPGARFSMGGLMVLCGLLWIALGLVMGKVGPNPYVGVRVPWTMKDEANWKLTHRFARAAFVGAGGGIGLAGAVLPVPYGFYVPLALMVGSGLAPMVFSYMLHRARAR